jgi:hypothetical protein
MSRSEARNHPKRIERVSLLASKKYADGIPDRSTIRRLESGDREEGKEEPE